MIQPRTTNPSPQTSFFSWPIHFGWLKNLHFDRLFILGTAALALIAGGIIWINPNWGGAILLLNIWFLGYHHVISTYTRLFFDWESFHKYKFYIIGLPILVLVSVAAVAMNFGGWVIVSIYYHWQWFHYTRQSYGIYKAYSRKEPATFQEQAITVSALYLLPLWGIVSRSYQNQTNFLNFELTFLPTPWFLVAGIGCLAILAIGAWMVYQYHRLKSGTFSLGTFSFLATHHIIFFVSYILIEDITHGWLVVNIWHNAQYILFVWLFNQKRFQSNSSPQGFLAYLCQNHFKNITLYFSVCLALTFILYGLAIWLTNSPLLVQVPFISLIFFQALNFHHYIVDALIWRRPSKKMIQAMK